jgi:hypothetical protein
MPNYCKGDDFESNSYVCYICYKKRTYGCDCRNICERIYSKIVVGESHYLVGKKYCRRCECYFITKSIFCQCCEMQLRGSPAERECKEKVNRKIQMERKRKLRLGIV